MLDTYHCAGGGDWPEFEIKSLVETHLKHKN